jgi:hypothetical protein
MLTKFVIYACNKFNSSMKSFDVNTSLISVPDTLHVQKLEPHEIGTNLFRKISMTSFYDADIFNIIG